MSMEQSAEAALYPYVTAPQRVMLDLVDALAACPAVSRIAIFGSLAEQRHDGWSDIDAFCAVEGEDGPWQAAHALRQAIPLRWHGPFNDVPIPSGRHWPVGESIFHCIDLSFDTPEEFDRKLAHGIRGFALTTDIRLDRPATSTPGRPPLEAHSDDYDFTHALYMATKSMKDYLRATGPWDALAEQMKALEVAFRALAHRPAGADPDELMAETRTLYYTLMRERARYGGDQPTAQPTARPD